MNGDWRRGGDGADTGIFSIVWRRRSYAREEEEEPVVLSWSQPLDYSLRLRFVHVALLNSFFNYRLIRYTPTRSKIVEDRNRRQMLNQRFEYEPGTVSSINSQVENKLYFLEKRIRKSRSIRNATVCFCFFLSFKDFISFCCPYHNSPFSSFSLSTPRNVNVAIHIVCSRDLQNHSWRFSHIG